MDKEGRKETEEKASCSKGDVDLSVQLDAEARFALEWILPNTK
jgi:hypothetical protein